MLEIRLSGYAIKFLKKCDKELKERVVKKIKNLSENPFPTDSKRVVGEKEKVFRVRVGDYRILYVIFKDSETLFVSDIDKRSRVYN